MGHSKKKKRHIQEALAEATAFREELAKKIGNTVPAAEIIREDRDFGH